MQRCVEDFLLTLLNFGHESTADKLLKRIKLASSLTLISCLDLFRFWSSDQKMGNLLLDECHLKVGKTFQRAYHPNVRGPLVPVLLYLSPHFCSAHFSTVNELQTIAA